MIRVAPWSPATRYAAALVECDDAVSICSIVKAQSVSTVLDVSLAVGLSPDIARRLQAQHCASPETIHVEFVSRSEWSQCYAVTDEDGSTAHPRGSTMRLSCFLSVGVACSLTLLGPAANARSAASRLLALLQGFCVTVGASVNTTHGTYTVVNMETVGGGCAAAFVGGGCKIKLNDSGTRELCKTKPLETRLIGLASELQNLTAVIGAAKDNPNVLHNVLLHGPRGCGVDSLLRAALSLAKDSRGGAEIVNWSPSLDKSLLHHESHRSMIVLVVKYAERYFSVMSDAERVPTHFALEKLRNDAEYLIEESTSSEQFSGSYRPAVVVIATTHDYGSLHSPSISGGGPVATFFTTTIALSLPNVLERTELLAAAHGGTPTEWKHAAHLLAGRSRAEVLAANPEQCGAFMPPFDTVRWEDIGGLADVKERIHKAVVWPQQHPEVFDKFNLTPPRGILLYGPPGCAKTTLVKALCAEGNFSLLYLDSATLLSAFVGESERRLQKVFSDAAQQAPCVVFFDEIEVIGARRSASDAGAGTESTRLLSTLLTELDGFASTSGVCFVGATNAPHLIDSALLRPGRFDLLVHVPLPCTADREAVLAIFLQQTSADVQRIAAATHGFSGADLRALCSGALLELGTVDATALPSCLRDEEWITSWMLSKVHEFRCPAYDAEALWAFHRQHDRS